MKSVNQAVSATVFRNWTYRRCLLEDLLPEDFIRDEEPELPEVSELDIMRHYTALSKRNHGVDSGFYPLGSCTMKYNPKINENVARLLASPMSIRCRMKVLFKVLLNLCMICRKHLIEITGMDEVTLAAGSGAHGEWTGLMMIRAYHEANGDMKRTKVIIPDSAHGTNPASATVAGFETVTVKSNEKGLS